MDKLDFSAFAKALSTVEKALQTKPANDLERDGAIQRFEYTLELTWKTGQKLLKQIGITSNSPKSVFRDLAQQGLIEDAQIWLDFVDARNRTSHIYEETVANDVYTSVTPFYAAAKKLLENFRTYAQTHHL